MNNNLKLIGFNFRKIIRGAIGYYTIIFMSVFIIIAISVKNSEASQAKGDKRYKEIDSKAFNMIIESHKKWLKSGIGEQANLCNVDLSEEHLEGIDLSKARMAGANLELTDLSYAYLESSDLSGANLFLTRLIAANLNYTTLLMARIESADLSEAVMNCANLSGVEITNSNLSNASLDRSNLSGASLFMTNLKGTWLLFADLTSAKLIRTDLSGCILLEANMYNVTFDPKPGSLPDIHSIAEAKNLETMVYSISRNGMVALRNAFNKEGYWDQEKKLTYAIKRCDMSWKKKEGFWGEYYFNTLFFDWTCGYGLYPRRPLGLLALFIPAFSFAYLYFLRRRHGDDGIWKVWSKENPRKDLMKSDEHTLIKSKGLSAFRLAVHFSLLSAFHIGWREINAGNWISRMQRYEYTLKATGFARTISTGQSLISVYLLALSILSYFGRPFG